uniref:Post-GPI attachment to proteins factor 3 n=1 Tax=Strongyloides venezuelensis TaxID=75913 RepID=A0A0K0FKD3_STRVS
MKLYFILLSLIFINLPLICLTSRGDNTLAYQACIEKCYDQFLCPKIENAYKWATKDCFECRYKCIWKVAKLFENEGQQIPQFHGKWPFASIYFEIPIIKVFFLIQEPASVLFSIFNLLSCLYLYKYTKENISKMEPLRKVWMFYGILGIITWIFSTIFHSFDTWQTEILDYSGAFAMILYQFYGAVSFQFFETFQQNKSIRLIWQFISLLALLFGIDHIYNLFNLRNYGYNMKVCLTISALTTIIYVYWIIRTFNTKSYNILNARQHLISIILLTGIGVLFEVFDFPPIYNVLDAHSIFHFFTIPTPILLSRFIFYISEQSQHKHIYSKYL